MLKSFRRLCCRAWRVAKCMLVDSASRVHDVTTTIKSSTSSTCSAATAFLEISVVVFTTQGRIYGWLGWLCIETVSRLCSLCLSGGAKTINFTPLRWVEISIRQTDSVHCRVQHVQQIASLLLQAYTRGGSRGWLGWLVIPWRVSLFHVIIMRVTWVVSMSFCASPRAKSWRRHCTKKLRSVIIPTWLQPMTDKNSQKWL